MIGLTAASELRACDSTGCLMVTRSAGGLLARKAFRVDLSYRSTDDGSLMSGSDSTDLVLRPKVDFEHGLVKPASTRTWAAPRASCRSTWPTG
jgi:hypothetical protein